MKHIAQGRVALVAALALLTGGHLHANNAPADPRATSQALNALLAQSNAVITKSSTCHADYGQKGPARVKHLLAMRMAYLYNGENVIQGQCDARRCALTISHAAGEDVASATIRFGLVRGRASVPSLHCVSTP